MWQKLSWKRRASPDQEVREKKKLNEAGGRQEDVVAEQKDLLPFMACFMKCMMLDWVCFLLGESLVLLLLSYCQGKTLTGKDNSLQSTYPTCRSSGRAGVKKYAEPGASCESLCATFG